MKVDYTRMMREYFGLRHEGFLTDNPLFIRFPEEEYNRIIYDAKAMRCVPSRPSKIKYTTARKLINKYRKEYKEKWG